MKRQTKQKLRDALIFFTHYSGLPVLRVWFYRCLEIPLLRVVAFHEIKDAEVKDFQEKLAFLKKKFNIISPEDFLNQRLDKQKINLLLTFDDAFESWLKNAVPVLKEENLSAIFFLNSKGLSLTSILNENSQTIGGHTVSHSRLTKIPHNELIFEIGENKKQLERAIGQKIIFFAYPFGDKQSFNKLIVEEVEKAGYQYGFTILPGFNKLKTNSYLLHRDSVDVNWGNKFLKMWLLGAYDCWKQLL